MLTVTETARRILRRIPLQPRLPGTAGLRIARHRDGDSFAVGAVAEPESGDKVLDDDEGGRVFLGPQAAERFDDHVLDARPDDEGRIEFVVRDDES